MAGTFLGAVTIGGALIGLSVGIGQVDLAFTAFRETVQTQTLAIEASVSTLGTLSSQLEGIGAVVISIGDVLTGLKASLRLPVAGDIDAQIAGILQAQTNLGVSLTNPVAYITGLIAGATQAITNLSAAVPTVQIAGQISATAGLLLVLQAKVAAIDLALAGLDVPIAQVQAQGAAIVSAAAAIQVAVDALAAIVAALDAAIAAADIALAQLDSIQATLATPGGYAFLYSGTLAGLGAGLDAVTPLSGLAMATNVLVPVIVVQQADGAAVAAVNATYKVS